MKLSTETIDVLKNFAVINQGIFFKEGKTLKTVSSHKNIMAQAVIKEKIPTEFGVYDLNNFLSVLSLNRDEPVLSFKNNNVIISSTDGRREIKYRFCAAHMIVTPPEKTLVVPNPEISFSIKESDLKDIIQQANVLSSPNIAVESDGDKITMRTFDGSDDAAHDGTSTIDKGNGDKYSMLFKTENFKMIPGDYDVQISSKGISHFKNKTLDIEYWIATEANSKFKKGS